MREKRKGAKLVVIPACKNRKRRERLEADDVAWLMYYFHPDACPRDPFSYPFEIHQRTMISAIGRSITEGGDQSLAAPRGEGKTTLFERLNLKYILTGAVKFAVLFAATGTLAEASLDSIKEQIEENDRLLADYPEVCIPVRALENTPNRAHYMIASGRRFDTKKPYEAAAIRFGWSGQEIVFPKVPGSPSSQAIIATRGLDSAVRGLKRKGRRVDVACIDDPDTEETARSEEQAKKLSERIDRGIAGLGSQTRRVARVMLTTIQSRVSASFQFTDRDKHPSFKGQRHKFLITPPDRLDLWDEYVSLRHADWRNDTTTAHEFYVANREAMDAGAVVANPNRYTQGELSALQFYFNEIARIGLDAVLTEYQNDPPEESGPVESGITPILIQKQLTGLAKGLIPPGCTVLTHSVDVGKWKLHWVVRAWTNDANGFTIDYGVQDVHGAKYRSDEGLDRAIRAAIKRRVDEFHEAGYCTAGGEMISDPITLVDAGYRTDAVYAACAELGIGVYPIMGFGKSAGCCGANFSPAQKKTAECKPGDGWKMVKKGRIWLVEADADRWKAYEHDRWMTARDRPGCLTLWGESSGGAGAHERLSADELGHRTYAQHICNEVEIEEMVKGKLVRKWKAKGENHFLDASYYNDVAANIKGVRLPMTSVAKTSKAPEKAAIGNVVNAPPTLPGQSKARQTLAQMAGRK